MERGRATAAERFTQLYAEQYEPMVTTARILLNDAGAAEEAVQEAFVRVHVKWGRVREETAVAYLRASVVNECRRRFRRDAVARRSRRPPPTSRWCRPTRSAR